MYIMESISYSIKHYRKNRESILKYKKDFYLSKTKYISQFKNINLRCCCKSSSNKYIKDALSPTNQGDKILINIGDNDELLNYKDFYEKYEIDSYNFSNIIVGHCFCFYDDDKVLHKTNDPIFDKNGGYMLLLLFSKNFLIEKQN